MRQRMLELELIGRVGDLIQEIRRQQFRQQRAKPVRRQVGDLCEQRKPDVDADHRSGLQQLPMRRLEAVDTARQHRLDAVGIRIDCSSWVS